MTECTLANNKGIGDDVGILVMTKGTMTMNNCTFGNDTTFADKSMVAFSDKAVGSIFGEGSLTMIISLLALVTSGVAIFLVVYYNKRNIVSAAANGAENTDEE